MKKPPLAPATAPAPATQTLTAQKSDFTAEGSPPPGKVSTSVPATAPEPDKTPAAPTQPPRGANPETDSNPDRHP
jgi:hypothetical protein